MFHVPNPGHDPGPSVVSAPAHALLRSCLCFCALLLLARPAPADEDADGGRSPPLRRATGLTILPNPCTGPSPWPWPS